MQNDTEEQHKRTQERKKAFLLADESEDSAEEYAIPAGEEELTTAEMMAEMTMSEEVASPPNYDCDICNKQFKSEGQLAAHEASKVHRKKVSDMAKLNKKKGGSRKQSSEDS